MEFNQVLLIDEDYIKTNSPINKNIWGDYLTPAIVEASDISLQYIIGSRLYCKICREVLENNVEERFDDLITGLIQPYLMYQTIANLIPITASKISNLGTVIGNDEHVVNLSQAEREDLIYRYQTRGDHYKKTLQQYLLNHKDLYPELQPCSDCGCDYVEPHLDSNPASPVFLMGKRTIA